MRNLILIFIKYGGFILFLLLEGLCFYMVVQYNKKQNQIFFSSANTISGFLYSQMDEVTKFWNLSAVADSISRENAQLYARLDNARLIQSPTRDTMFYQDTLMMYEFMPAKVRNNSISSHNNFLTIELGEKQKVKPGMGVVSKSGLVGVINKCTEHFASVMSILNKESRISAAVRRNGYHGFLVWRNSDPTQTTLIDIPKHADLVKGDTIQTSGYSSIFPEGIMIGTIEDFYIEPGSNFYTIDVALGNDLSNIKYVYVINNLLKNELEELKNEGQDE
ncbi:MAG: rod shape-determining protein MreC [Bacteroidota bacterium]